MTTKKIIKCSRNFRETIFEDENFELRACHGVGVNETPWSGLEVITKEGSLAKKHAVEIRLHSKGWADFDGTPVVYQYKDCYVAHGMRSRADTLSETQEYIDVLEDALDFAKRVNDYIYNNYDINDYED